MCALRIKRVIEKRNKPQTIITNSNTPTQPVDKYLQRFSHFAQIGLLALGAFGYFYTVQPIYQNQQLQEQSAKLELEKSALEKSLNGLKSERTEVENEIYTLKSERDREKLNNYKLSSDIKELETQEEIAKKKINEAHINLQNEQIKLEKMRWKLVADRLSQYYLFRQLDFQSNEKNMESKEYFLGEEKIWKDQYSEFINMINQHEKDYQTNYDIPSYYFNEVKLFFMEREKTLRCEKPDFDNINKKYILELETSIPEIEAALEKKLQEMRDEEKVKGRTIIITEEYREHVKKGIRLNKIFKLLDKYRKPLRENDEKCRKKIWDAIAEFRQAKNLKD